MKRKDVINELLKEGNQKRSLYPKRVQSGKMKREEAKRRIELTDLATAIFQAITDTEFQSLLKRLEIKKGKEMIQGNLFE